MDFTPSLKAKSFFKFTGPPENWLTAIKYMTWGLEQKYLERWKAIQPGDVFFIHSTKTGSLYKNSKSAIIGIGVVGSDFSKKENFLWIQEQKEHVNRWPLLVPFSEIYLFSDVPDVKTWEAPNLQNHEKTQHLVDSLLRNVIPLANLKGFPQMGSFSTVSHEVAEQILQSKLPLYVHEGQKDTNFYTSKSTKFEEITHASEGLRYAETLRLFDEVNHRIVKGGTRSYVKNNDLLARAEEVHSTVLDRLIDTFRKKGYETRYNKHVDLFAYNEERSFLFEVKSTENKNFRSQARKGTIQLFEYDYFEVRKFVDEQKLNLKEKYKILVPSQIPKDEGYVKFMNSLKVGVAMAGNESLEVVGSDFGFSKM